jgi:anti-anti-sigma regulatory factor
MIMPANDVPAANAPTGVVRSCGIIFIAFPRFVTALTKGDESMSTATTIQAHIAYERIEYTNYEVVVIEFVSHEIGSPARARELGEQLHSLIRPQPPQYFVIDCAGVRFLGSTAFGELLAFVRKARPVWLCNLDERLRLGAALIGLDGCARFAANRRAAIKEAERTARQDEEDTIDYP